MSMQKRTPQRAPELAINDLAADDPPAGRNAGGANPVGGAADDAEPSSGKASITPAKQNTASASGRVKQSSDLNMNTFTDDSAGSSTAITGSQATTSLVKSVATETESSSTGDAGTSGSSSETPAASSALAAWASSSGVASSSSSTFASASSTHSSSQASWTENPAPASTSWTADLWENKQVEPATSSSTWTSEWSQPSTESSNSWSEPAWTSSSSSWMQASYSAPADTLPSQEHSKAPAVSVSASSSASVDIPGPTPSAVGTLTNTGNIVSSTGLITNDHGNSSAEAANGSGTEGQQTKIGHMGVGPFAGLLVGLLILAIVGYLVGDLWHKKKTGDSTPLWRCFVNKFRDRDPNDGNGPFNQYTLDPFVDQLEKNHRKRNHIDDDAASSFYNVARLSKWSSPITAMEPHNFASRGQEPFGWLAPPPPAISSSNPLMTQHPRASQYIPTSGRIRQSAVPSGRTEPSRPESDEILADYHRDSAYENLIDEPAGHTPKRYNSTKRKTTATTMTEGSLYSVDSIWGNASEAPPTARSSLQSSFLPWRRSNSVDSLATQLPAVPAIPDHIAYQAPGQAHTVSKPSRLSSLSKSASYGRLQDAAYDMPLAPPVATRGPPKPAMAQTPIGVKQNPGFGTGGFVLPLGGFSR